VNSETVLVASQWSQVNDSPGLGNSVGFSCHCSSHVGHAWAFARLQERIDDKAREAGLPVESVEPSHTSQTCHECGHVGYRNGEEFRCPNNECWVSEYHADINAAANIADRQDPWGESLPLKPAGDDISRDGSACDSATTPTEQSQPRQMPLGEVGSEPTAGS
jgi:putative transposase